MKNTIFLLISMLLFVTIIRAQSTTNTGVESGTAGIDNVFVGYEAGEFNTANRNTFIGSQSGDVNVSGTQNVFLGFMSGSKNTSGDNNVFLGMQAGSNNNTGNGNISIGTQAGQKNTSGSKNTIVGYFSGRQNLTGVKNAFFGHYAGQSNTGGDYNVFIGNLSGYANLLGENNAYLGSEAGYNSTGSNNVFIGYKSGFNETGDDKLYIDNSDTSTPLLYGDFITNQLAVNTNTIPTGYAFAVKGKIISEEITVKVYPWADFVFEKDYNLPTLKEVENHIKEKGHLKDIPNANEIADKGLNVGEMEALLLQKIEELTLYTIQQEKEIKKQKEINKKLENRLLQVEYFINQQKKK